MNNQIYEQIYEEILKEISKNKSLMEKIDKLLNENMSKKVEEIELEIERLTYAITQTGLCRSKMSNNQKEEIDNIVDKLNEQISNFKYIKETPYILNIKTKLYILNFLWINS